MTAENEYIGTLVRPPPANWSADLVRQRLVEAFVTERKMPGEYYFTKTVSAWPATPIHEFADIVGWDNPGDTARERNWENWEKAKGAYPIEVSRMEEAYSWLTWLGPDELKCLRIWALSSATGMPIRKILKPRHRQRRLSRSTLYRKAFRATERIADRLNREGVQVR